MPTPRSIRKFDSIRNVLIPDYSFDSDLQGKVEHWHISVDSDVRVLRRYESELGILIDLLGKRSNELDSEYRARKDEDSELRASILTINQLDSEIRERKSADSDLRVSTVTLLQLDSEIHERRSADSDIRVLLVTQDQLDSDILGRKSADSDIIRYVRFVTDRNTHNITAGDSDLRRDLTLVIDSERHEWKAGDSDLYDAVNQALTLLNHNIPAGDSDVRELIPEYEEGTWTPTFEPRTGAFTRTEMLNDGCFFTRVGNMVTASGFVSTFNLNFGAVNTGTDLFLGGLPYPAESAAAVTLGAVSNWGAQHPCSAALAAGDSRIEIWKRFAADASEENCVVGDMQDGEFDQQFNTMYVSVTYRRQQP